MLPPRLLWDWNLRSAFTSLCELVPGHHGKGFQNERFWDDYHRTAFSSPASIPKACTLTKRLKRLLALWKHPWMERSKHKECGVAAKVINTYIFLMSGAMQTAFVEMDVCMCPYPHLCVCVIIEYYNAMDWPQTSLFLPLLLVSPSSNSSWET